MEKYPTLLLYSRLCVDGIIDVGPTSSKESGRFLAFGPPRVYVFQKAVKMRRRCIPGDTTSAQAQSSVRYFTSTLLRQSPVPSGLSWLMVIAYPDGAPQVLQVHVLHASTSTTCEL